jgi:hypothetical protein
MIAERFSLLNRANRDEGKRRTHAFRAASSAVSTQIQLENLSPETAGSWRCKSSAIHRFFVGSPSLCERRRFLRMSANCVTGFHLVEIKGLGGFSPSYATAIRTYAVSNLSRRVFRDIVSVYDSLPPSASAAPLSTHSAWWFRSGLSHIGRWSARQSQTPNRFCNRRTVAPGQVFDAGRFCRGSFSNPIRIGPRHGRDVDSGLRDCQRIFATVPLRRAG